MKNKKWNDYMWIATLLYFSLGFFNIVFAWLGMICFVVPLLIAIAKGNKAYCNKYCGRSQLLDLLGNQLGLSAKRDTPKFFYSKWFRYGFLTFFMVMFLLMIFNTYLVFAGAPLKKALTLLWTFKLPWQWVDTSFVSPWVAQFSFGFFSVMLTSTLLGLVSMALYKPRTWCAYCPMGTMTQGICMIKHRKDNCFNGGKCQESCGIIKNTGQ